MFSSKIYADIQEFYVTAGGSGGAKYQYQIIPKQNLKAEKDPREEMQKRFVCWYEFA